MNSISETNTPAISNSKESRVSLDLQDDLKDLLAKITSFSKVTAEFLTAVPQTEASSVRKISLITKALFGIVATLTFALNVGLNFLNASYGQMIIANMAISVLYVLVGMCLISDLSRGRTHFQNEREQLRERIQTVSEFLRNLLQERVQLVNSVSEIKWHLENEQTKFQMCKLEVASQQEKLEYLSATITDKTSLLDDLKQNVIDVENQHEKLLAQKQALLDELDETTNQVQTQKAEIDCLASEVESLKLKEQDAEAALQATNDLIQETSVRCEERQLELVATDEKLGSLEKDVLEKEDYLRQLSDKVCECENRLLQLRKPTQTGRQQEEHPEVRGR